MRKTLIVLGLAAISSLAMGTSAMAEAPKNAAAPHRQAGAQGAKDQFEKVKQALAQVGLSADQQKQIDTILTDAKGQLQTLRASAKGSGDKSQLKEQAKTIVTTAIQQIRGVLTDDQKTKLREIMAKERGGKRQHPATQA